MWFCERVLPENASLDATSAFSGYGFKFPNCSVTSKEVTLFRQTSLLFHLFILKWCRLIRSSVIFINYSNRNTCNIVDLFFVVMFIEARFSMSSHQKNMEEYYRHYLQQMYIGILGLYMIKSSITLFGCYGIWSRDQLVFILRYTSKMIIFWNKTNFANQLER